MMKKYLPNLFFAHSKDGATFEFNTSKVVCVGRNYREHAKELNNLVPTEPVLFIKPSTALCDLAQPIKLPKLPGECHHELELAVLIKETLTAASLEQVKASVWGYGLALDLTLRDIQTQLKEKSYPWEKAKAFDGSCPISPFVPISKIMHPESISLSLFVNDKLKQEGSSEDMIFPIYSLISHISNFFTLLPGDVVLTGTPKGVGPLKPQDKIKAVLGDYLSITSHVL